MAICAASASPASTNIYCQKSLCVIDHGATHVACTDNSGFDSTCPDGATQVTLDSTLKNLLLNLHNTVRNNLALGNVTKFDTADRMIEMVIFEKKK